MGNKLASQRLLNPEPQEHVHEFGAVPLTDVVPASTQSSRLSHVVQATAISTPAGYVPKGGTAEAVCVLHRRYTCVVGLVPVNAESPGFLNTPS